MDERVVETLMGLNRDFYERFARAFSDTRGTRQPGLQRLLSYLDLSPGQAVLDVGCGNGRLALLLEQQGRTLHYLGLDSSAGLLEVAQERTARLRHLQVAFRHLDVTSPGWADGLFLGPFQIIAVLALLHHVPSWRLRCALLASLRPLLAPNGVVALSTWQFLSSERLRRKITSWRDVDIDPGQLELGDYLLDWRRDGYGLRYCHLIDEGELAGLAAAAGLGIRHLFYDDGRDRNLNLFAILDKSS